VKVTVRLAGAQVGLSCCRLRGPKSVRSDNGRPQTAPRRLLLVLINNNSSSIVGIVLYWYWLVL